MKKSDLIEEERMRVGYELLAIARLNRDRNEALQKTLIEAGISDINIDGKNAAMLDITRARAEAYEAASAAAQGRSVLTEPHLHALGYEAFKHEETGETLYRPRKRS